MFQVQACSLNLDTGAYPGDVAGRFNLAVDAVTIGEMDVTVLLLPFLKPAPNSTAVNPQAQCNYSNWQLLLNEQLHSIASSFRGVNIGNIGHSRLSFLYLVGLTTVYEVCFLVAKVVG